MRWGFAAFAAWMVVFGVTQLASIENHEQERSPLGLRVLQIAFVLVAMVVTLVAVRHGALGEAREHLRRC
jgi:hypothetical protein